MPANDAQLLEEFVDRETELERFVRFLDNDAERVLAVWGGGGVGKSSLLAKMFHECSRQHIKTSEFSWAELTGSYLEVMRRVRDHLGASHFQVFSDLANYFTVQHYEMTLNVQGLENVSVLHSAKMRNVNIGNVSAVSIQDLMIPEPRTDMRVPEEERRTRLTDAFLEGLASVCEEQRVVIFLDAAEKMTDETEAWLWHQFLAPLVERGCTGFKCVLCGRREPQLDRSWRDAAVVRELKPLTQQHIEAYLIKRGVRQGVEQLAKMLAVTTQGNMLKIAVSVDAYLAPEQQAGGW